MPRKLRDLLSRGECDRVTEGPEERVDAPLVVDREYNGEFRYVNCSPMKLRRLMASEDDPDELVAMEFAMSFHRSKGNTRQPGTEAGYVHRGDPRPDQRVRDIRELTMGPRVKHVSVGGALTVPEDVGEEGWLFEECADGWDDDVEAEFEDEALWAIPHEGAGCVEIDGDNPIDEELAGL